MKRHLYLLTIMIGLVVVCSASNKEQPEATQFDKYGGYTALHFDDGEGTGFFRTKYDQGKWWLVTPDNNAFLSFGLNHFHANLWTKDYNKEYWEERFDAKAYSDKWRKEFSAFAVDLMNQTGCNTFGYHNEDQIATILSYQGPMPYIKQYTPLNLSLHLNPDNEDFVDIFDSSFVTICQNAAQEQVAPYKDDPYILGFAMSDIPTFTEILAKSMTQYKSIASYNLPTWAQVLRNLDSKAKGKQKYVEFMKERYNNIDEFNKIYSTKFKSWKVLLTSENWRSVTDYDNATEIVDNNEFNKICIDQYYRVTSEAFREVDSNHLFFGDKINANLANPDELSMVVEQSSKYTDVILVQFYGKPDANNRMLSRITSANKPIINGDGGFGATGDPRMPKPQNPTAGSQTERAQWFIDYASSSFSNPNFVGYHICGVIDGWNTEGGQKPGIINPLGSAHQDVVDALNEISLNLYNYHK